MNARTLSALVGLVTVAAPALARDLDITKNQNAHVKVWHTLGGFRYGDPAYDGDLPAGHNLKIPGGNHWWTDFSVEQNLLAMNTTTTTGLAMITGGPGNYAMADLAQAVDMLAPLSGGRISIPDLQADSFFDIFVCVDLDNYVQSSGHSPGVGQVLQFVNGQCTTQPGLTAARAAYTFNPSQGWISPQPYTGPLRVFGEIGLTPKRRCYANCDGSTTAPALNVLDFACFLNQFAAGDQEANCDGSTTPPTLNVLDFACFLNQFSAGCS